MNEISYTMQGDYQLPNLTLPEQPEVTLGRYAEMRRKYLKEHHRVLYYNLLTSCNVPFPKKRTRNQLEKPNENQTVKQPRGELQTGSEIPTPERSEGAESYKKLQCTQKYPFEPPRGSRTAADEPARI